MFFTLVFLFMTGSLIGWVIEVIYRRLFSQKHWVNPGYLTGPCLPLYGISLCMLYLAANAEQYIPIGNVMIRKAILFVMLLCQESGQVKQTKSYQLTSLRSETRDLLYNFSKSSGERYPQ